MKMRKIFAVLLAVILCLGLVPGCGESKDDKKASGEVSVEKVKEESAEKAEAEAEEDETASAESASEKPETKEDSVPEKKEDTASDDVTAESLLSGFFDTVDDIESQSFNMAFLMNMEMSLMGQEQKMDAKIEMHSDSFGDNSHMTGQLQMESGEEKQEESIDQYIMKEDGEYVAYSYDKESDSWSKTESDKPVITKEIIPEVDASDFTVEEVKGQYKVSGTMEIQKVLESMGETFGEMFGDMLGTGQAMTGNAEVEYLFNKDTKALEAVNIYMGDALKEFFTQMISGLFESSEESKETDLSSIFTMNAAQFDILLTDFVFNEGKEIVLPAAAAGAAETDSNDEKGILEEEEEKIEEEAEEAKAGDNKDKKSGSSSEEGIEVVEEYLYSTSYSTMCYLIVKNNTEDNISISGNAEAKDADGKTVGASELHIDVLGPGEISGGSFYFDGDNEVANVDYELTYKEETYYTPILSDLDIQDTYNDTNVVLVVTNNGKENAGFVSAQAIFLDKNDEVTGVSSAYLMDNEYEIKTGKSIAAQLDCSEEYDHVVIYLEGKSSGRSGSDSESKVSASDFEIKEYMYETDYDVSMYFVTVTNNSDETVSVSGNALAKDKKGRPLSAGNLSIDVLGPGETSIGEFYFNGATDIDKVEYELEYSTDTYYKAILKDIRMEESITDKKAVVTLTNEGKDAAQFTEAVALFFDKDGKVVYSGSTYIGDDDYELKPGKSLSGEISAYEEFDHAEVYLMSRAEK